MQLITFDSSGAGGGSGVPVENAAFPPNSGISSRQPIDELLSNLHLRRHWSRITSRLELSALHKQGGTTRMSAAAVVAFLAGLSLGVGVCWGYLRALKAKIRLYETYIHERLNKQFAARDDAREESPRPGETVGPTRPDVTSLGKPKLR